MPNKSITQPLNFKRNLRLKALGLEWDSIPLITLLTIAFMFSLLDRNIFQQPGLAIKLPEATQELLNSVSSITVLTVTPNRTFILGGKLYTLATLTHGFQKAIINGGADEPILLLKADHGTEMQLLFEICELAKKAGFVKVQIATNFANETL
jgi:biopolymer transport protein ExbD